MHSIKHMLVWHHRECMYNVSNVLKKVPWALACYLVTITIIYVFVPAGLDLFIFCEKCNMCQGHCIYYLECMLYWFSLSNWVWNIVLGRETKVYASVVALLSLFEDWETGQTATALLVKVEDRIYPQKV